MTTPYRADQVGSLLRPAELREAHEKSLKGSAKRVVLGLVSTKKAELESADDLKRRIDEAAKYVPLENLCLSPQCGFASTYLGNPITPEIQRRKIERVVEVALAVWGTVK